MSYVSSANKVRLDVKGTSRDGQEGFFIVYVEFSGSLIEYSQMKKTLMEWGDTHCNGRYWVAVGLNMWFWDDEDAALFLLQFS